MGDKVGAQRLRRKANALGLLMPRQKHPAKRVRLRGVVPGERETEIRLPPPHVPHDDEPLVKLKLRCPSWVSCTIPSRLSHVFAFVTLLLIHVSIS